MNRSLLFVSLLLPITLPAEDLIFAQGSEWEVVSSGHQFVEGMAWDKEGDFYFTDVSAYLLFKVNKETGEKILLDADTGRANGITFGPDGRLYGCSKGDKRISAWNPETWERTSVSFGTISNDIAILKDGTIFYTDSDTRTIWRLAAKTFTRSPAAHLPWKPNGITLSQDEKALLVAEFDSDTVHGFPISPDSTLNGTSHPAYRLGIPSEGSGKLDGMMVLSDERLLIGTALGIQIAPPVSPPSCRAPLIIIPSPDGRPRCNYARISPDNTWLYAAFEKDLLRRKLRPDFQDAR